MTEYADFLDIKGKRYWVTRKPMPAWMGSDYLVHVKPLGEDPSVNKHGLTFYEFVRRWPEASHLKWHPDWMAFRNHIEKMRAGA